MSTRPRLVRSIPFWGLVVVSLATAGAGAFLLDDKISTMTTTLTDGSATPVDVYVGQSVAGFGAVLVGAGIVGILLALGIAAASTLRPREAVQVVEPAAWDDEAEAETPAETAPAAVTPAEAAPAADASDPDIDVDAPAPMR